MSTEQNKALVRRMVEEVFNQQNIDAVEDLVSPDFVEHEVLPPGVPAGREAPITMFNMLFDAFPDFHASIEHLIAEDDLVVVHMRWTGTHEGEFMGIPPTGRRISINVNDIIRIADGMYAEHWGVMDQATMMRQLGVMPE